jgi:hypothetical protein
LKMFGKKLKEYDLKDIEKAHDTMGVKNGNK